MDTWSQEYEYVPESLTVEAQGRSAPTRGAHLASLAFLGLAAVPAAFLIRQGEMMAGTLLLAIPLAVISLSQTFIGLCILVSITPLSAS